MSGIDPDRGRFGRRFRRLFLLGLVGIAALPLTLVPLVRETPLPPGAPEIPLSVLVLLSLVQPAVLLAVGVAVGAKFAPRVGLTSLVAERADAAAPVWPRLRASLRLAVLAGLALAAATVALDALVQPYLGPEWAAAAARAEGGAAGPGRGAALVVGLLYGGITEELIVRWGLMSILAWAGWRLFRRGTAVPAPGVMWTAIILTALLFGLSHLPAVAAIAPLNPALIGRTVLLNALGGLLFGWLYWRRHLEAAMVAHASAHAGFALLALGGLA